MSSSAPAETLPFQAHIAQLMGILVNALYSRKDVFLRELVSNASDAIDKARRLAVAGDEGWRRPKDPSIRVRADAGQRTLTIEDDGVGMTREELVRNLGTVAHSGTKALLQAIAASGGGGDTSSLIGQFGVGFYSAFLVADRVRVVTRSRPSDPLCAWEAASPTSMSSDAAATFTVQECAPQDETPLECGCRVVLHLRDDAVGFLEQEALRAGIRRHCQFITYPIRLRCKDDDWELLNGTQPLWTRSPDEVSAEEHDEFYKALTRDVEAPRCRKHFRVEGAVQYAAVLYVGRHAGFEGFRQPDERRGHVHLYVRRVFVMDNCEDIIPAWLDFVKGIVDTSDLPINVSREMLQSQADVLSRIRKSLVPRCIDMLADLASSDPASYNQLYDSYGKKLKMGALEDCPWRPRLMDLLRFRTSACAPGERAGLHEYIARMRPGQKHVYVFCDSSDAAVAGSIAIKSLVRDRSAPPPFVERLLKLGYEVVYMDDAVDEYLMSTVRDFDGTPFADVTREGLFIPDDEVDRKKDDDAEQKKDEVDDADKEFLGRVKDALTKRIGRKVEKAVMSNRLVDTPCVVSVAPYGWTANMQRIMGSQPAGQDSALVSLMQPRRIFELNRSSPLVMHLRELDDDGEFDRLLAVAYEAACIASGFSPDDPAALARMVFGVLVNAASAKQHQR